MWLLELNSGPLEEQSVLLTAEPSLQPFFQCLSVSFNGLELIKNFRLAGQGSLEESSCLCLFVSAGAHHTGPGFLMWVLVIELRPSFLFGEHFTDYAIAGPNVLFVCFCYETRSLSITLAVLELSM